jgi:hypothetical protein
MTSFYGRFPLVLGLRAWSPDFFVAFNLFWLTVWLLSATGFARRLPDRVLPRLVLRHRDDGKRGRPSALGTQGRRLLSWAVQLTAFGGRRCSPLVAPSAPHNGELCDLPASRVAASSLSVRRVVVVH